MFIAEYRQTMRNAKPKLMEEKVVVRTVDQMRAEKRIAEERKRRELAAQWVEEMKAKDAARRKARENEQAVEGYSAITVIDNSVPKQIIAKVAAHHGFTYEEILSKRRDVRLVVARHEAMRAVRDAKPEYSLPKLGRLFKRDHSSVLYALRKTPSNTCENIG